MNRMRVLALLVGLFAIASIATAQDLRQRFVGKSPCAPELLTEHSDFSLQLDNTQQTTLLYRTLTKLKILMIVQPTGDAGRCGVILDLVEMANSTKNFEFRCFDAQAPTDVVIGTTIRKGSIKLIGAIDAWKIDLKQQKFVPIHDKVVCSADGWAGEDGGADMVEDAKLYAAHGKPGQFQRDYK